MLLEEYIKTLNQIRSEEIKITDFLGDTDVDETNRYRLLVALQYDHQTSDESILLELFKTEIETNRNNPMQGVGTGLVLCAYLLSAYERPQYCEYFLQAKQANFDTHCGFDLEFLLSAGKYQNI